MKDKINVVLTDEALENATAAIELVAENMPYLIALTPGERRHMVKVGLASEGFIQGTLELARQNPHIVPPLVNMTALERDLALRDKLAPLEAALTLLATKLNHTRRLANADLYDGCLDIYHELQRYGQDQGLDALIVPLRERFKARPMVMKDEEPPPAE